MKSRRAFSIIELLTVISIMGILATIITYGVLTMLKRGRDTKRKSDISAIYNAFETRYQDKVCPEREYPGANITGGLNPNSAWVAVSDSRMSNTGTGVAEKCDSLSNYLPSVPSDPQGSSYSYIFNLKNQGHLFILGACLEQPSSADGSNSGKIYDSWVKGMDRIPALPRISDSKKYNYFISK